MDGFAGATVMEVSVAATALPLRLAVWGLLLALSTTVNVPGNLPAAVGENVTLITQLPPGAIVAGHEVAAKGPVVVTLFTVKLVDWLLVKVAVWAALVEPTDVLEKSSEVGDK